MKVMSRAVPLLLLACFAVGRTWNYAKRMKSSVEALLDLCGSLCESTSREVFSKVNRHLTSCTGATFAFILTAEQEDLACRMVNDGPVEGAQEEVFTMAHGAQLIAVLQQHKSVQLHEIPQVISEEFCQLIGTSLMNMMLVPVYHPTNSERLSLVSCVANKNASQFDEQDRVRVSECMRAVAPMILRTMAYEEEKRLREECNSLLTVAKNLFTHLDDVTLLLREIMTDARDLTRAERCSLFLLDKEQKELVAKVFDGDLAEDGQETCTEVRIPADQGIAGRVATTGEVLNIRDAYNHPLFYRGMDEVTGFKTRNILCFPIKDDQEVIGVAELCNKSRKFTERPSIAKTETMALHGSGRLNVRFRKASGAAADKWSTRRFLHTRVFWTTGKISDEENLCPALLCPSGPKPKPRVRAGH